MNYPILYILMRSDMISLNAGKAMAQAAHAANMFQSFHSKVPGFKDWLGNRGFGTTIVLNIGTHEEMKTVIEKLASIRGYVLDPTYPVRDGDTTHYIPIVTCAFVFGDKEELAPFLGSYPLYK